MNPSPQTQGRFPFNVRVYGLLIEDGNVLVSDEHIDDLSFTKFPGGGLEFGEGTIECVVREWKEELDLKVEVLSHFYTTDLFQRSAFNKDDQVISIYYELKALEPIMVHLHASANDLKIGQKEAFRWLNIENALVQDLTFKIDQVVLAMLQRSQADTY